MVEVSEMGHYFLSFTAGIIYDRGERVNNVDDVTRKRRDGQDSNFVVLKAFMLQHTMYM